MTFRGRLRLFFTIIVVVPMLAILAVLFTLTAESEEGKADAGFATGLHVALSLYRAGHEKALNPRIRSDVSTALASGDPQSSRAGLRRLLRSDPRIVSATLSDPSGDRVARAGSSRGVAPASFLLRRRGGGRLGTVTVSVTNARTLVRSASRLTGLEFMLLKGGRAVATTAPGVREVPKDDADFEADGRDYRGRRVLVGKPVGIPEEIAVFEEADEVHAAITDSRILISAIVVAFLLLALATSVFVVRALHGQIGQFLSAARRIASGRFDQPVQTQGQDEFAELGREFNSMSKQLASNIRELERKRLDLEETIRTVGKAFATGLDTQGILDLAVQTALKACEADACRAIPLDRSVLHETRSGLRDPGLDAALEEAERRTFSIGPQTKHELSEMQQAARPPTSTAGPTAVERDGMHALALALYARLGSRTFASHVGVLSIARRGRRFTREEEELLQYLAGQAVVSIENADLHKTVQQQAITDELTGLSNRRQMHRALDREFERARRFNTPLGLVILDIDDFKNVNDTYGHPQGDEVLVQVAAVLRDLTRNIDEPIRMGGEEFAVVLPETDLDGADQLAERMREAVEQLRIPRLGGSGRLRVTASFGVAAVPVSAAAKDDLITVTDAALSRAKRAGKNRVERAEGRGGTDLGDLT